MLNCVAAVLLASAILSGCAGRAEPTSPAPPGVDGKATGITIVLGSDLTRTIFANRVPLVDVTDMNRLIDILRSLGGDLFVIPIGPPFDPHSRLVLQLPQPPRKPMLPICDGNVFQRRECEATNARSLAQFRKENAEWQDLSARAEESFREQVRPVLSLKPAYMTTDIAAFFDNSRTISAEKGNLTRKRVYAVLVSDCVHDAARRGPSEPLPSNAQLLVVNTSGRCPVEAAVNAHAFATVAGAATYIENDARGLR